VSGKPTAKAERGPRDGAWSAAVFLAALALYARTAAPDFLFDDNPEFISSAYLLGVSHPPGYPIISLFGKLFAYAAPGAGGFAVNLLSAFAAAGAIALSFRLLRRMPMRIETALLGAAILATSRLFWEQAVQAEAYSLNFFFLIFSLNIVWGMDGTRGDARRFAALGAVSALGMVNHYSMALALPVIGLFILWTRRRSLGFVLKWLAPAAMAAAVGFSITMYLPARSAAGPAINWDDQTTVSGFFSHLKGVDRRTENPRVAFSEKVRFARDYGWRLWRERTPALLLLLPVGVVAAAFRLKERAALLAALWLALFAGFILLLNFMYGPRASYVVKVFHIASLQLLAVFIAIGADAAVGALRKRKYLWVPAFAVLAGMVAWSAAASSKTADASRDDMAPVYARNMLINADRDAIIFSTLEIETFPISASRAVAGMRRDIVLIGRQGDISQTAFSFGRHDIPLFDVDDISDLESFVVNQSSMKNKLYFTKRLSVQQGGAPVHVNGLMYQLLPHEKKMLRSDPWDRIDTSAINTDDKDYDRIKKTVVSRYLLMRGEHHIERGDWPRALDYLKQAEEFNPESRFLRAGLGAVYMAAGDFLRAAEQFEKGLECDPENVEISIDTLALHSNLSFIYGKFGRHEKSLEHMKTAARLSPKTPVLRVNLGKTYWNRDMWREAVDELEAAVSLGVENAAVHAILGICYEKLGMMPEADINYRRSLELNPNLADTHRDFAVFNAYSADNPALAIEHFNKYLELLRADPAADFSAVPDIYVNLGLLNQKIGDHAQAVADLRMAVELNAGGSPRKRAIIRTGLARSFDTLGMKKEAGAEYEMGIEGASEYPDILKERAAFLDRNNMNRALAAELLERYLEAVPDAPDRIKIEIDISRLRARTR